MAWLEGFTPETFDVSPGFPYRGYDVRAVCWHTTEGWQAEHAFGVYARSPSCPHFTVQPSDRRKFQHVDTDLSCYALQRGNATHVCGVETNASGVVQIEVVGFAAEAGAWSNDVLRWLGEDVLAPILEAHPNIPPSVYKGARMTETEWFGWRGGQCGHKDACCQPDGHWDPGDLDLDVVLEFALRKNDPAVEETDMVLITPATGIADGVFAYNGTHLRWVNNGNELGLLRRKNVTEWADVTDTEMRAVIGSTGKVGPAPTSGAYANTW